jgi:dihydrolipoamide dehydrogenase
METSGSGEKQCKVAVLGGGPAGYSAAIRLAQLGVPTVLVDEGGLGGICLREGCIPSKALLSATKTVRHVQELIAAGVATGEVKVDPAKLTAFKDKTVNTLVAGLRELMKANRVEVVAGHGTITARGRIRVTGPAGDVEVKSDSIIVCSGSRPVDLPALPVDGAKVLSSSQALNLAPLPASLCVVGGGYIGLELATVYARLGTKVTVVELKDQVMPGTDRDLVLVVAGALKRLGVAIMTEAAVVGADLAGPQVVLQVERKGQKSEIRCEKVLVAVGRRPVTEGIGIDAAGLQVNGAGFLDVDDRMQTRSPWLFAAGDVAGPPLLAHKAHAEGEVAAEAAAGHATSLLARVVPAVAFTEPEVATVGLTETVARSRGVPCLKGRFPLSALGRALAEDASAGFVKVLAHPETHVILGAGIVGAAAGEVIAEATLAIEKAVTLEDAAAVIHSHPTFAEAFQEACRAALGRAVHIVNR